ncbi:MAG: hypothetical protein AAGC55_31005 [Myxococcota bacterium]
MTMYNATAVAALLTLTAALGACVAPEQGIGAAENEDAIELDPVASTLEAGRDSSILPGERFGEPGEAPELQVDPNKERADEGYKFLDRTTYHAYKHLRGTTTHIHQDVVRDLCGDEDGCTLRLGMHDWDGLGRTASRSNLLYYNPDNRRWRTENGDQIGTDYDNTTEHIMQTWSCYFTDSRFVNWSSYNDISAGFGLLSWNQYNADCRLTIID